MALKESVEDLEVENGAPPNSYGNSSETGTASDDCIRLYFNQTESQRLTKELSSWVERHAYFRKIAGNFFKEKTAHRTFSSTQPGATGFLRRKGIKEGNKNKKDGVSRSKKPKNFEESGKISKELFGQMRKPGFIGPALGIWAESLDSEKKSRRESNSADFSLQIFNRLDPYYLQLLKALRKRDDTFYLVSFRKDYMLLPASSSNNTAGRRPRMSLVVPALPLNETMLKEVPKNHIPMMQIECEVTATGLVNVPENLVPPFKGAQQKQDRGRRAEKN